MEVIPHQAISKRFGHRRDVFGVKLHEIGVVALFDKDVRPVDPTIIDVVVDAGFKGNDGLHRLSSTF